MEILVCVKQVPDDSVKAPFHFETAKPDVSKLEQIANAFDTYALEMAVRLKESVGGHVTVCCIGQKDCENTLKHCLAVGADQAFLFCSEQAESNNINAFAESLTRAIRNVQETIGQPLDVIFCGKESTDTASGQVGAMIAEKMHLALAANVIDIQLDGGRLQVKQETEAGYDMLEVFDRAVICVSKPIYEPRYPTIKSKMAARKAAIPYEILQNVDIPVLHESRYEPPKERGKGMLLKDFEKPSNRTVR